MMMVLMTVDGNIADGCVDGGDDVDDDDDGIGHEEHDWDGEEEHDNSCVIQELQVSDMCDSHTRLCRELYVSQICDTCTLF